MCGFAGMVGKPQEGLIDSMLEVMRHRGPDDRGKASNATAVIGHNRLSIIDLAGGKQPITNESGDLTLVANGEIYNFRSLKQGLRGHRWKTGSDSEVILHLYEEVGPDCVRRLDGMFVFAILGRGSFFLARDPLGIKPLYYGLDESGNFCFASEIKGLVRVTRHVHEFPPGHFYHSAKGFVRYYRVPGGTQERTDVEGILNDLALELEAAVEKRLMADVPVGVFLSGGLDSSLIAAIASKKCGGRLKSFAVGTEGSSDLLWARRAADYLGTDHHELVYRRDQIIDLLDTTIYNLESFDPALVRSAVPTFLVSRLARQHVTVVLSGEGADELFAGYHYLKRFRTPLDLHRELHRITSALHNTNLQRLDRQTMANSIEGRVPFLDVRMVRLAMNISPKIKMGPDSEVAARWEGRTGWSNPPGRAVEKWLLRNLAERYLPTEVAWRKKEKFAIGTGTGEILENYAEKKISDEEYRFERITPEGHEIKSKEELLYYRIFRKYYGYESVVREMGRSRSLNPEQMYH